MGFFSWMLADKPKKSVSNVHSGRKMPPFRMLLPDGSDLLIRDYEGYGEFLTTQGALDWFLLVDKFNGGDGSDRDRGIKLDLDGGEDIVRPKLVSFRCTKTWAELPDSKICPSQGFFY